MSFDMVGHFFAVPAEYGFRAACISVIGSKIPAARATCIATSKVVHEGVELVVNQALTSLGIQGVELGVNRALESLELPRLYNDNDEHGWAPMISGIVTGAISEYVFETKSILKNAIIGFTGNLVGTVAGEYAIRSFNSTGFATEDSNLSETTMGDSKPTEADIH